MSRHPSIHNAYHMIEYPDLYKQVQMSSDGKHYVPARREGYASWRQRWRCAWMVFTGRADALVWPGQET